MVSMFESMYIFGVSMWEHVVEVGFLMAFIQLQAGLIGGLLLMATAKLLYKRSKIVVTRATQGASVARRCLDRSHSVAFLKTNLEAKNEIEIKLTMIAGGVEARRDAERQYKLIQSEGLFARIAKKLEELFSTSDERAMEASVQSKKKRKRAAQRLRRRLMKERGEEDVIRPKQIRRRRLAYGLVRKCLRRKGNRPPRLDGKRFVPRAAKEHALWLYDRWHDAHRRERGCPHVRWFTGATKLITGALLARASGMELIHRYRSDFSPASTWQEKFDNEYERFGSQITRLCHTLDPLSPVRMMKAFSNESDEQREASDVALRAYVWSQRISKVRNDATEEEMLDAFDTLPLIWDTGASRGLTPYRSDFIHYQKTDMVVHDISKANRVIGIGTVMYKFKDTNGREVYLPGVAYHMPKATIRLFSPQTYLQTYGGHATVHGSKVIHHLPPTCAQKADQVLGILDCTSSLCATSLLDTLPKPNH